MISLGGNALGGEKGGDVFSGLLQGHINDSRPLGPFAQSLQQQLAALRGGAGRDVELQVGAMEAGADLVAGPDLEGPPHIGADLWGGGGGQGQNPADFEFLGEARDLQVFGAKIVPPFGDAVSLVDGQQGDGASLQAVQEAFVGEAFGGDIEQSEAALGQLAVDDLRLAGADA